MQRIWIGQGDFGGKSKTWKLDMKMKLTELDVDSLQKRCYMYKVWYKSMFYTRVHTNI